LASANAQPFLDFHGASGHMPPLHRPRVLPDGTMDL
jgi:hypothetical protein